MLCVRACKREREEGCAALKRERREISRGKSPITTQQRGEASGSVVVANIIHFSRVIQTLFLGGFDT